MQLPRGTFRSLKRGCALETLIAELGQAAFCGYCRIVSGSSTCTLVFENGVVLIAEYDTDTGDAAWDRILENGMMTVDAVINDLNPAQLDLALEFSPQAVVKRGRFEATKSSSIPLDGSEREPVPLKADHFFAAGVSHPANEGSPGDITSSSRVDLPESPHPPPGGQDETPYPGPDDEEFILLRELDALDSMDIETLTEKFRANCRVMIERFNLEHLIVQKTKEDIP